MVATKDNDTLFRLTQTGFRSYGTDDSFRCCKCHRMQPAGVIVVVPTDLLKGRHSPEQVTLALAATPGSGGGCCVPCAGRLLPHTDIISGQSLRSPSELGIYD